MFNDTFSKVEIQARLKYYNKKIVFDLQQALGLNNLALRLNNFDKKKNYFFDKAWYDTCGVSKKVEQIIQANVPVSRRNRIIIFDGESEDN